MVPSVKGLQIPQGNLHSLRECFPPFWAQLIIFPMHTEINLSLRHTCILNINYTFPKSAKVNGGHIMPESIWLLMDIEPKV